MRLVPSVFAAATLLLVAGAAQAFPQSTHPAMLDASKATETAPAKFQAKFTTTKGDVVFDCTRDWAPHGVDRFYNLVKIGYFDDVALFRMAKGFVVQWGIHGNPKVNAVWRDANLPPDPPKQSNTRGMLTYAMAGSPDTRSTQLFINFGDNSNLDGQGFAPICKVTSGMEIAESFYSQYGEQVTGTQGSIQAKGNDYLHEKWPNLDYIKTAAIVGESNAHPTADAPEPKKDDGTGESTVPYVVGGLLAAGALVFFLSRKKADEAPKRPAETTAKTTAKKTEGEPVRKKKKKSKPAEAEKPAETKKPAAETADDEDES